MPFIPLPLGPVELFSIFEKNVAHRVVTLTCTCALLDETKLIFSGDKFNVHEFHRSQHGGTSTNIALHCVLSLDDRLNKMGLLLVATIVP
mgnify:FL=1